MTEAEQASWRRVAERLEREKAGWAEVAHDLAKALCLVTIPQTRGEMTRSALAAYRALAGEEERG